MSLLVFDPQTHLFGLQARSSEVFSETDRYRLFAQKIYPLLVESRPKLEAGYCLTNGRPGVEPVLLLGVSVLQFLERVPDRQAVQLVKYQWGEWGHISLFAFVKLYCALERNRASWRSSPRRCSSCRSAVQTLP